MIGWHRAGVSMTLICGMFFRRMIYNLCWIKYEILVTDTRYRGFEEGPEWELLREYVTGKSMVLDNPALMEGME